MSSWVAVQGATKAEVLDALGQAETGERVQPGARRSGLSVGERANGWLIVFSEDFDWADAERVRDLSRFGLTVGCQFEDKVEMASVARSARDGAELWCVVHVNDDDRPIDVTGAPPPEFDGIHDKLRREQEEDDCDFLHDVPLEVAKAACGYRADDDDETVFIALKRAGGSKGAGSGGGLLARLLAPFARRPGS